MATLTRSLTYAQLVAEIAAGTLHKGESITITDYATSHNIYDGFTVLAEVHTGTVEPLLVTATSANTLDVRAKSVLFPKDIIHYNISDNLCEDTTTARTGKITFRKDHLGNETHYDFRGVMFRRWKFDLSGFTAWVSKGTFTVGDKITYNNKLFYCTKSITGSTNNPEILTANFNYVTDNQRWLSWQTANVFLGGDPVNERIEIPVDKSAYFDFYTFSDATGSEKSEWFKDMKLGGLLTSTRLSYNSLIFVETAIDQSYTCSFGINCYFMTFGNNNSYNIFGNNNRSNTFGNSNNSNTFGNNNSYNTFGNGNNSNTFGNNNSSNTFGNVNSSNTFGNSNYSNIFGNYNSSNTFGNSNSSNTFGNSNNYNIFGNNNDSNTFGNDNSYNTFGNINNYNTFGNSNFSNTFGNSNSSNTFGNNNSSNTFGNLDQNNVFTGIVIIKNTFKNNVNGSAINYSGATHLIGDYDCEISRRVDGTAKLTYINNSDVITVVAVNA